MTLRFTKFNIKKAEKKLGIDDQKISLSEPVNVTSFDESKKGSKFSLSSCSGNKNFCCFWDRHPIPEDSEVYKLPIKYIPNTFTKNYYSHITKDDYSITEHVSQKRFEVISDEKITKNGLDYCETDEVFCSLECMIAYLEDPEIRRNPFYYHSKVLVYNIYKPEGQIEPAPHWRILKGFGGSKSISKFRNELGKITTKYCGYMSSKSVTNVSTFSMQIII